MSMRQRKYNDEFKNTIVELYNSGKSLSELSSEYGISKSTISCWLKKSKPISVDKDTTITAFEYQAMLKKMVKLEEKNCNIYVKSRSAGCRVMSSIKKFIKNKLKLEVNENKSARKYLGFLFYKSKDSYRIRIHEEPIKRFKEKVREITNRITNRNKSISMENRIKRLNQIAMG